MSNCHHVVVPSVSIRDMLAEKYGASEHVSVVPTGIDLHKFCPTRHQETRSEFGWKDDTTYLVSVGRLAKEKSFDLLIKAYAQLRTEKVKLVIIGSGDEKENLEKLARELGVAEGVTFTGLVPFDAVPKYLAASDLFVFASVTETQGLVTLEAMASGLPVVAVEASGTREAVGADSSILTEHNAESLARGIDKMLAEGDLSQKREAARNRAESFGLIPQGKAMIEVYQKATEAHAAKRKVLIPTEDHRTRWREFLQIFRV